MKKTFILTTTGLFLGLMSLKAQTTCSDDRVAYVNSKNTGPIGAYTLTHGYEEKAAQTYHYSGPGKVGGARIFGAVPPGLGVKLKVSLFNVDANDRPTGSALATAPLKDVYAWSPSSFDVSFSPAVSVNANFAVVVEVVHIPGWGHSFELSYNGNGEGNGEDLASLSGTSTGFNWASAMTAFNKDGDFYIYPRMINFNTPMFSIPSQCVATSTNVAFTNTTQMTQDPMFNIITAPGYSGLNYLYSWDFGDGSPISHEENPSHIFSTPGVYTVTLTSFIDGWSSDCSKTYSKTISVGLDVNPTSIVNTSCFGLSNGTVVAVGTGGATPYQYSINGENYYTNGVFNGLSAGTRTLSIKDNNGCIQTKSFTITQPTAIQFTSSTSTNASCGNSDGAILVATTGGVSPIQYQLRTGNFQPNGSFSGLSADSYLITAKDANGCMQSNVVVVNDLGGPEFTVVNSTNVSCFEGNDGSISLTSFGGTGVIKYSIDGGQTFQTSGVFSNIAAGNYTVIVKDAAGCSDIRLVTINQPQQLFITASKENLTCFESKDGQIDITSTSGGTGTISYSLNGISFQSDLHFSNLSAGIYTVFARDIAGCTTSIPLTLTEPSGLTANISHTNAHCFGSQDGSISVEGNGGTPSYMYSLGEDNFYQNYGYFGDLEANNYAISVKDANGCIYQTTISINQPSQIETTVTTTNSTCGNSNGGLLAIATGGSGTGFTYSIDGGSFGIGSFTNLSSNVYVVSSKDDAGCIGVVNATISDSDGPSILTSSHTNVNCHGGNNGTITVGSVSGGTGTLTYSINGSIYQTSPIFNNLIAGEYEVTVKDMVGCIGQTSLSITEPNAFVISNSVTNVSCYGENEGEISLLVGGGAGTLAYSINDGVSYQSSNTFSNLAANFYQIIVKDAGGCLGYTSAFVSQPKPIIATYSSLRVFCHGGHNGSVMIHASGGQGTLMYSSNGTTFQTSNEFNNLTGGIHTFYIKDQNNCMISLTVSIFEPKLFTISGVVSNVTCAGGDNGVIDLTIDGGSSGFQFDWSNGATTEDIFNLEPGTYNVQAVDGNGCIAGAEFVVLEPFLPIIVNGTVKNAVNQHDGSIDITSVGGEGNFSYLWSNGSTSEDINNLSPGIYTVVVTDGNNCSASSTFVVSTTAGLANVEMSTENIQLYPNPANTYVIIEGKGFTIDKIEVVDVLGQISFSSEFKESKVQLNTSGLEQGVYFVKIQSNKKEVIKKLNISK